MFISGSPTILHFPSSTPPTSSKYDPFSEDAICANLTSTMGYNRERKRRRRGAICVAYNPTSTLLAVATPIRLRVLLGKASNHVLLGDVEERLGKLEGGPSLLWKHNSSCIAAVSSEGRLLIYAVKQAVESQPLHASFDMPDWIEHPDIQYEAETANVNMETDGQELDAENWMEPRKALLKPYPPVILESSITAMCAGKFGRSILVGTRSGMVAKISWLGEVWQLFKVMDSLPQSLSVRRTTSEGNVCVGSNWMTSSNSPCTLTGFGIKSITFNNSLQMLAMVRAQGQEEYGSLCLGVLCGDTYFIRDVTVTESDAAVKTVNLRQKDRKGFEQGSSSMPHQFESLPSAVSVTHVAFSTTSSFLGVCLLDGTILVSRVEHYRTGTRSTRQLSLRRMSTESYKLSLSDLLDIKSEQLVNVGDDAAQSLRERRMAKLWGYEVQHLLCLNYSDNNLHGLPQHPEPVRVPVSSLCFSPDASAVAVAQGASLMIWSTVDGKQLSNTSFNDEMSHDDPSRDPKAAVRPENGPFCSLSWGYYGYRIIAAPDDFECSEDLDSSSDTVIVAFDILSSAASELSSAQLCFQSHDRVIILDTLPWEPKMRYWRTLPVHQGYIAANGPVKHVSTSPSGVHIAVAGSNGLAIFNRAKCRWHLFSSIQQEREMAASGICWWGEEAVFVLCRQASGYKLHLYPRYHLSANSDLFKPLRLPPGLKPSFMSCITEGHEESVWLLIGGSRDCFVYHFRARTSLLKAHGTDSVYLSASYEAPLPHILDDDAPPESLLSRTDVGAPRRMFLVPHISPPCVAILDYCGILAVMSLSRERKGSHSSGAAIAPEETPTPVQLGFSDRNPIEVIKRGVVSMVDISSLFNGKLFGTNNHLNALYPCYLLHYFDMDDGDDQYISNNSCLQDTLWCPALNLKPLTQQSRNVEPVLGDDEVVSPHPPLILGHDQVGFVSAFRHLIGNVNMGLVPSLGSTVHVSQIKYTSIDQPTRFELSTITYPSLCIILRHLVVLGRLQQQRSGQEIPRTHPGCDNSMMQRLASHIDSGVEENPSNTIIQETLPSDTFSIAALLIRKLMITYPGCIPETLELLLRHELEELRSAHSRQRRRESSQFKKGEEHVIKSPPLSYWPYFDTVYLSQVAPECFLEVLARVARKVEPELASFLFPIHLITVPSKLLLGNIGLENIHATWYLTLIRDDIVLGLVEAGNVEDIVGNIIPPEMYPLTISSGRNGWRHGLSHALTCCLFFLVMEQGTTSDALVLRLLPEIWLFARKRECSPGLSTPIPTERKKLPSPSPGHAIQHEKRTSSLQKNESSPVGWIGWLWGTSNLVPPTHPVTPLTASASRAIDEAASSRRLSAEESNNNDNFFCSSSDDRVFRNSTREPIVADPKLVNAGNRARELYSISPSDASAVLSRFLWKKLASSDVIAAMTVFSSLTQGEISKDAGIDKSAVLSSLRQPPMSADHRSPAGSEDTLLMDMFLSYAVACRLTPREAVMVSAGSVGRLMLEQLWCVSKALHHCESMLVCALLLGKTTALSSTLANSPPRVKAGYPVFLLSMKSCIEAGTETEESILDDAIARRLAQLLQLGSRTTVTMT
eukprot:84681_1